MICDFTPRTGYRDGLGASVIPAIVSTAGQAAAAVVPATLVATGTLAAGSLAVPVIGAAIAGVTLAISLFLNRNAQYFGEESATTQIVNQAAVLLKQNLDAWNSLSAQDKTAANQQQALANFDGVWQQVVQACNNTAYSHGSDATGLSPGARCVADRAGTAHGGNGKYDWYAYYRDPIANDTIYQPPSQDAAAMTVSQVEQTASQIGTDISSVLGGGSSNVPWIPIIMLGLGIWALSELS